MYTPRRRRRAVDDDNAAGPAYASPPSSPFLSESDDDEIDDEAEEFVGSQPTEEYTRRTKLIDEGADEVNLEHTEEDIQFQEAASQIDSGTSDSDSNSSDDRDSGARDSDSNSSDDSDSGSVDSDGDGDGSSAFVTEQCPHCTRELIRYKKDGATERTTWIKHLVNCIKKGKAPASKKAGRRGGKKYTKEEVRLAMLFLFLFCCGGRFVMLGFSKGRENMLRRNSKAVAYIDFALHNPFRCSNRVVSGGAEGFGSS